MAKTTKKRPKTTKKKDKSRYFFVSVLSLFFVLSILLIALLKKNQILYYYALYFHKYEHKTLKNTAQEEKRIDKIIHLYSNKTFGMDISHYQRREDILWDSLTIAKGSIPLRFIILRATMGNSAKDNHFDHFWHKAKQHGLIRGAYHFYRPDEDPVLQARSYLDKVKLQNGDFLPVLDIEKLPRRKSKEQYLADIKTWLSIVEQAYGRKPIVYTYYHFYKDYLRGRLDGYPLWLANYNDVPAPSDVDEWQMWQFTENGISPGVNVKVDLNIYNGTEAQMQELLLD